MLTGASHYGIGDIEALVRDTRDTHKFESHDVDLLIAPYSEDGIKVYKERSPINYVEKLNCALALFQGDEDKVQSLWCQNCQVLNLINPFTCKDEP